MTGPEVRMARSAYITERIGFLLSRIIDSHGHIGACDVFGVEQTPEDLLSQMDRYGIHTTLVQPFPGVWDAPSVHDEIAAMADANPGRVYGVASIRPHGRPEVYENEIRRCVQDLGFVGIKIHTIGHGVGPRSPGAGRLIAMAGELEVPLMIHTGAGIPFADPGAWLSMIRGHPNTQFILAHAGAGILSGVASAVAQACGNVYLETSSANVQDIKGFCTAVGLERILFGSDMITGIPVELAKYEALQLGSNDISMLMSGNAAKLFNIPASP